MNQAGFFSRSFAFLVCVCAFLSACDQGPKPLQKTSFESLPFWGQDDLLSFGAALKVSCAYFEREQKPDWVQACDAFQKRSPLTTAEIKQTVEFLFEPFVVTGEKGFLTGYYEVALKGARQKTKNYATPLYGRPDDLIRVDPTAFGLSEGRPFYGKKQGVDLVPYETRKDIVGGALRGRARPLFWVEDDVDRFFLEAQGSGRILLPDGTTAGVDHAASNGRPYVHIGPMMLADGSISRPASAVSMKKWLKAHRAEAATLMNKNPAFVFFKERKGTEPMGSGGMTLTANRSLAVDRVFMPLGAPVWVVTGNRHTLGLAQDTGSAIKGPVRGDLFLGYGAEAEQEAGQLQERARFYVLLPRDLKKP